MSTASRHLRTTGREIGFGFLYWLSFLIALEPGNVSRAVASGSPLSLDLEVLRILGASMLGALATPAASALMRRFPIEGIFVRRHLAVHCASAVIIAFGLIVASCLLAPVAQVGDTRPFLTALPDHLARNWLLLAFCFAGLTAVLHAARFLRPVERGQPAVDVATDAKPAFLAHVQIKTRGHLEVVDLSAVDWIEAQGNYVALHCGATTHLLRETLSAFEAKLDPVKFARVHRSRLVAIARVAAITPVGNGDGTVRLIDGTELRLSRGFRERVHARLMSPSQ